MNTLKTKRNKLNQFLLILFLSAACLNSNSQDCDPPVAYTNLEINLINASVVLNEQLFTNPLGAGGFEYPAGSELSMVYDSDFWVSGTTPDLQLKMAAGEGDFYAGPLFFDEIEGPYTNIESCNLWDQFFVAYKSDSELHLDYYNAVIAGTEMDEFPDGYEIPEYFYDYPAMGQLGQLEYLAPFYDFNADGIYDPSDGDCPMFDTMEGAPEDYCMSCYALGGDVSVFWITNDMGGPHLSSNASPIGIEIHNILYGFENTGTALDNALFLKKRIVNRGTLSLTNFHASYRLDSDLGNPNDDYIGCDIDRNLAYTYNGDPNDEFSFNSEGYGIDPPAFGVLSLQGMMNPGDLMDDPMDGFITYSNSTNPINGDPQSSVEFYNYQQSVWRNGQYMNCGGSGSDNSSTEVTKFIFPDETGEGDCENWSELAVGNPPGDRRMVVNEGEVNFEPGQEHCLIYAFAYAENLDTEDSTAVDDLQLIADSIISFYDSCFDILTEPTGVLENHRDEFNFFYDSYNSIFYLRENTLMRLYDSSGRVIKSNESMMLGEFDLSDLPTGIYFVQLNKDQFIHTEKIIVK